MRIFCSRWNELYTKLPGLHYRWLEMDRLKPRPLCPVQTSQNGANHKGSEKNPGQDRSGLRAKQGRLRFCRFAHLKLIGELFFDARDQGVQAYRLGKERKSANQPARNRLFLGNNGG